MGGLPPDEHVPGLFVLGEANFSEHGANRLGASALMQGLADGYFIAPATVTAWLAGQAHPEVGQDHPACREALARAKGRIDALRRPGPGAGSGSGPALTVDGLHRQLGLLMIEACGISRNRPQLERAIADVEGLRQRFKAELRLADHGTAIDPDLEKALRLEDFFCLADLMLRDALEREESCGAHFREEHQTAEGEALRDDERFAHIAAWAYNSDGPPQRHREPLSFTVPQPERRDYR